MALSYNSVRAHTKQFLLRHERAFVVASMLRRLAHLLTFLRALRHYRTITRAVRRFPRSPHTQLAVVLHLFYVDRWPRFLNALQVLQQATNFDLFVTLRPGNLEFEQVIRNPFPGAMVLSVPNLGRDVLPFMQIAPALAARGYQYVLKLHSKKSPHHPDAVNWFESIVSNLVPNDPALVRPVLHALKDSSTGVIGAEGQYISLRVWLGDTDIYLRRALHALRPVPTARTTVDDLLQYGFFAGTMFWARLDSFEPIFKLDFSLFAYDIERGQMNDTFAHALERLFSLVPILEGRLLYEISPSGLRQVRVTAGALPWWSDVREAEAPTSAKALVVPPSQATD
jgi:lipopolysaccharide biosynthesis protein